MSTENSTDREMTHGLERLACGELEEAARQPLIDWLEHEPRRWRLCGLAFLEAQTWSIALDGVDRSPPCLRARDKVLPGSRSRRARIARGVMLAVSLVVAFTLGWSARPANFSTVGTRGAQIAAESLAGQASEAIVASLSIQSAQGTPSAVTLQIPVVPGDSEVTSADTLQRVPDYVRQQWERRGYRLTAERRYLFAKLPSGQQIVVPIDRLIANPLPSTVY